MLKYVAKCETIKYTNFCTKIIKLNYDLRLKSVDVKLCRPQGMEKELICMVCEKPFQNPVILPCTHHACLYCAESLISYTDVTGKSAEKGCETEEKESHAGGKVAIVSCPACEKTTCIGNRDVQTFPKDRILEKLVNRSFGATSDVLCQMCDTIPPNAGTISCEQCDITYCEKCCKTYHPRRGPLASHMLVSPSTLGKGRQDVMKCSYHREENISMYCVKCKTTVCYLCVDRGKHRKHDVKALGEMFKEQKVCEATRNLFQQACEGIFLIL